MVIQNASVKYQKVEKLLIYNVNYYGTYSLFIGSSIKRILTFA